MNEELLEEAIRWNQERLRKGVNDDPRCLMNERYVELWADGIRSGKKRDKQIVIDAYIESQSTANQ